MNVAQPYFYFYIDIFKKPQPCLVIMTFDDVEFLYAMNSSKLVMSDLVSCSHIPCGDETR